MRDYSLVLGVISSEERGWEGVDRVEIGERSSRFRDAGIPLSKTFQNSVFSLQIFWPRSGRLDVSLIPASIDSSSSVNLPVGKVGLPPLKMNSHSILNLPLKMKTFASWEGGLAP